jgi:hypothetical protein
LKADEHAQEIAALPQALLGVRPGPEMERRKMASEDVLVRCDEPPGEKARHGLAFVGVDGVDQKERPPVGQEELDDIGSEYERPGFFHDAKASLVL